MPPTVPSVARGLGEREREHGTATGRQQSLPGDGERPAGVDDVVDEQPRAARYVTHCHERTVDVAHLLRGVLHLLLRRAGALTPQGADERDAQLRRDAMRRVVDERA